MGQTKSRIKAYDPYSYLNLDFHLPHPSEKNPGFSTVIFEGAYKAACNG